MSDIKDRHMRRVLITGGAGSIGTEVTRRLAGDGYLVRVFDLPFLDFSALEALDNVEIVRGDIAEQTPLQAAVEDTDCVLHLAALLPFASETDRDQTFRVNLGGTANVVKAIQETGGQSRLVLSSTVATYGNTMDDPPPVAATHAQQPVDIYGESKVVAEQLILDSGILYTILRISGVVIPALLDPPDPYPFIREQRMEFVARSDVADALCAAIQTDRAANKIFNISGGGSWQMLGHQYVEAVFRILDLPPEDARYRHTPWWSDWYDTTESQAILSYQRTSFSEYLEQLGRAVREALGEP
jgi:nucleoside-diphosphate-sugar epimerase